jgi:hypothetical protein
LIVLTRRLKQLLFYKKSHIPPLGSSSTKIFLSQFQTAPDYTAYKQQLQMVKSPQPIRPFQIIFENGTTALWQQPR